MVRAVFVVRFIGILAAIQPALGQTTGSISGQISDSSGSAIAEAKITVINPQTNFTRETPSNSTGIYNFPELPPGIYNVRAEKEGFRAEVRTSVELQVQQTARIDFQLNLGAVSETVEVSGGSPLLNTENATVGTVIENQRIVDLPLNGRSFISLVSLSPNVITGQTANSGWAATRGSADRGSVSLSISGMRREFTYYTLDGVTNTDVDWNTYAFLPSVDALQEFKVQTGVYSAEFGRETAQVNISTKSGTNGYHGTVFEFLRNNDLDARPYAFSSKVPPSAPFKWNQYGFTLGGPVQIPKLFNGRDRLFFMSNFEGFKLRSQTQQLYSVPSVAMRGGDFSEILPGTLIKDPKNNNQPFSGNIIPSQRLDPIAVGLLEFYPAPNIPGAGLSNNYLALDNNTTDKVQFTQRLDFVESAKSNWFGRYSWQDESLVSPALKLNGISASTVVKQVILSNIRILSPTLVNEFRAGYLEYHNALLPELASRRNVLAELNIPLQLAELPTAAWGTPYVSIVGFSAFGSDQNSPFVSHNHTFQWTDGLTWTHGAHSLNFGAEVRRDRVNGLGGQQTRGVYTVQNQATGYGFSDYMLGYPQSTTIGGTQSSAQLRATSQAYFANDNWKVRRNLTIEMGLRYEYTPPWSDRGDSLMNFVIPPQLEANPYTRPSQSPFFVRDCAAYGQSSFYPPETLFRFDPAIQVNCDSSLGNEYVRDDRNDFAPRLGIAWSPSSKWTIRSGVGVFYAQDATNPANFDLARNLGGSIDSQANFTTHDLTFEHPATVTANVCGVPSPPFVCVTRPATYTADPDRRTPFMFQYETNIQRQLTDSTVLEIGYLGSKGYNLQRLFVYNDSYPSTVGSPTSRTAFPEIGLMQITRGLSRSNYNAGSVKLTRRLSKGLSALIGYTFSKSLDDGSGIRQENTAFTTQPQNGWCVQCEYSYSDFDSRHRFVASVLYQIPVGRGQRFLNRGLLGSLLGGWQLNSIINKSSGFPLQIRDGVNRTNTSLNNNRPDAVYGVSEKLPNPTAAEWFNILSVQLQPLGSHFGNLARSTVIGPGIFDWDFSTLKNFNFTERTYLQFRFECFNCANHPNFGDPGNILTANRTDANGFAIPGTGTFGQITGTRPGIDMRELQFSLKLIF